jgi:aryl-alcohol dehydrogenase
VDYSFDTTGIQSVVRDAVTVLRVGGLCGLVAMADEIQLDPQTLIYGRGATSVFLGQSVPQVLVPLLIEWWQQGLFPFDVLLERFSLEDINEAVRASASGRVVKPVLIP